jgi:hypothetical protein
MAAKSEYDAAYFAFLRAVEERDDLLRYREFLQEERERLDVFARGTNATEERLPARLRRPVGPTARPLLEAVGRRRNTVLDELRRVDDRVSAAEGYVMECEQEVARLRR